MACPPMDWFSWATLSCLREDVLPFATFIGAVAVAGAAWRQANIAWAQAKIARERHEEQTKADRERRITESFAKAAELLGSEKLATRLGGIYTLKRLSRESEQEYWPIVETLTVYVREHAPWPPRQAAESPKLDRPKDQEKEPESLNETIRPATDVQAVLTVLGHRDKEMRKREAEDQYLDLSRTDLRGANLKGAHLERASLAGAQLEGAILKKASIRGAWLVRANLEDAILDEANLEDATFWHASLAGASIYKICEAHTRGADSAGAHFERNGKCANFEDTNLANVKNLT